MRYRPEIDGLRTLAVAPVVLFHVGFEVFGGGYIGVDVFFVISGYLITSIIYGEIERHDFSIVRFYERRIRRIFPALFCVFAFCLAVGWFTLLPSAYESLGISAFWSTLFVSNILFWSESGYFDADAETKPLLHTWSLSVEEQFYVVFPPALLLLYRFGGKRAVAWFVTASIVASFVWAVHSVAHSPNAAFYLAPARIWELGIGALLAIGVVPAIRSKAAAEVLSMAGLAMICASVFLYDGATPFPGTAALLPCLGVALLVHATDGHSTAVARFLSTRPMVFIGLLSYSLYLWHWPVIVFFRTYFQAAPDLLEKWLLVGAGAVLAYLSWRFVERPFRKKDSVFSRRGLFAAAGVAMGAFLAVGIGIGITDGSPSRLPDQVLSLAAAEHSGTDRPACYGMPAEDVRGGQLCKVGDANGAPQFLVWGDSHGYALMPGFEQFATDNGMTGYYAPKGSCAPVLGTERVDRRAAADRNCGVFGDAVLHVVRESPDIHTVVLVGRWAENFEPERFRHGAPLILRDSVSPQAEDDNRAVMRRALTRTVDELLSLEKRVVIMKQVPELAFDAAQTLAYQALRGDDLQSHVPREPHVARQAGVVALIEELAQKPGVEILDLAAPLCDSQGCVIRQDATLLFTDDTHLSVDGARRVMQEVGPSLLALFPSTPSRTN